MGKAVYCAAAERTDVNVVCGVDKESSYDFDCPVFSHPADADMDIDVIVDFTSPALLGDIVRCANERGCGVVFATTGYNETEKRQIAELAEKVPVCISANMSAGISAIGEILPLLKDALPNFDIAISETHRRGKRDKPSGTALSLAKVLGGDIEICSIRGGDVAGIHEILFFGKYEIISVKHTAISREVFAEGALDACVKLCSMPCGLYGKDMRPIEL